LAQAILAKAQATVTLVQSQAFLLFVLAMQFKLVRGTSLLLSAATFGILSLAKADVAPAVCPLTHATGETATPTGNTTTAKIDTASEKEVQEESLILVGMILNIDYHELKDTKGGKDGLKGKLRDTFAKIAGVDQAAVSLELTLGEKHHYTEDVKVYAEIQMPDADSAQSAVKSISASNVKQEVVEVAKSIPDVQASAMGELKVVCLEVKAAGTAPETAKAGTTAQAAGTERETKKGADVAASAARNSLQMKKVIWALATISLAVSL